MSTTKDEPSDSRPTRLLPPGSWDAHVHVFGSPAIYQAANPDALYAPPEDCEVEQLESVHQQLGIEHAILVQPTIYATDHRYMCEVLRGAPQGRYYGVAIVNDTLSDQELAELDGLGVRGARFNFGRNFRLAPSQSEFKRSLDRVHELGWFVKVFGFGDDFLAVENELRGIRSPAIIDHIGGFNVRNGPSAPVIDMLVDLLKNENWWALLSNGDLRSEEGPPWDDVVPFGRRFFDAAPSRCVWGSDWPHVHRFIQPEHHEISDFRAEHQRQRIALLERYLPDSEALVDVLASNPARFFRQLIG